MYVSCYSKDFNVFSYQRYAHIWFMYISFICFKLIGKEFYVEMNKTEKKATKSTRVKKKLYEKSIIRMYNKISMGIKAKLFLRNRHNKCNFFFLFCVALYL